MRPGQAADLFHMFPGERGIAAPNPQNKSLKKEKPKRQRQLAGVGFQESCRQSTSAIHGYVLTCMSSSHSTEAV